mgnify:FL=1
MSLQPPFPINLANKIDGDIPIELLVYCGCIQYWYYCLVVHNKHSTVYSESSVNIPYEGKPLESRTTCHWKIKVTTNHVTSAWSRPAQNNIATLDKGGKKFYLRVVKPSNIVMEENIAEAFTKGEARVSGYKLLRISSPATTSNEKVIFKILLCSDLNRITATVPEDKILSEWN